jgi:hypothetical protein
MRLLLLPGVALLAFTAFMVSQPGTASAAVCADGVYRAGCAGPHGAVVVKKTVVVDGVRVRRCS